MQYFQTLALADYGILCSPIPASGCSPSLHPAHGRGAEPETRAGSLCAILLLTPPVPFYGIERSRRILETASPEAWEREGQKRALQVFHAAARRVPAYKDFLKKHHVQHEKVRTIKDFPVYGGTRW